MAVKILQRIIGICCIITAATYVIVTKAVCYHSENRYQLMLLQASASAAQSASQDLGFRYPRNLNLST